MNRVPDQIDINDFYYELPESRIAKYPLKKRDKSKLIMFRDDMISVGSFTDLPVNIPEESIMVFNETRVIQARLIFYKESGPRIEIFCLEPHDEFDLFELALQMKAPVRWKCMVGNAKKWKEGSLSMKVRVPGDEVLLKARVVEKDDEIFIIEFTWEDNELSFSEILDSAGKVPLPPYIKRASEPSDKNRYQTIYARYEGSVAAPTAGLHFSDSIMKKLMERDVDIQKHTLHVSAGTFKPVSAASIKDHTMHSEKVVFQKAFIERILSNDSKFITAVGTTSIRSLESLYWLGVKMITGSLPAHDFHIEQWDPYTANEHGISNTEALKTVLAYMEKHGLDHVSGQTQLIIIPGYKFRFVDALVTNFHMPKSTLLLLVAAMVGERWKDIYATALSNDFRFLSYGDSCLLFR